MKVDKYIQYWAHMLDEAFDKSGMLAEGKQEYLKKHSSEKDVKSAVDKHLDEEEGIVDNDVYLSNMAKSFADKAWFLKYIPKDITTIVDFGGGTGDFAKFCRAKRPDLTYAVVDNNASFFDQAKSNGFIVASSL